MRTPLRGVALALALVPVLVSAAHASGPSSSFSFFAPSRNIQCEMDTFQIGCGTTVPARAVFLSPGGRVRSNTSPGDVGVDARVLPYGHSHTVGPFRCTMRTNGVTCLIVRTGHGFRLARAGVTTIPTAATGSAFFWDGSRARSRPTAFWYTGDGTGELTDIRWQTFGGATARGTGSDRVNDCKPTCAGGSFARFPSRFTLSRPVTCHGRLLYSLLVIVDPTSPQTSGRRLLYTGCPETG